MLGFSDIFLFKISVFLLRKMSFYDITYNRNFVSRIAETMMKNNKYYTQFMDRLEIKQNSINILKQNNIITLGELSNYKKIS